MPYGQVMTVQAARLGGSCPRRSLLSLASQRETRASAAEKRYWLPNQSLLKVYMYFSVVFLGLCCPRKGEVHVAG
jgi:hypothetical protein